MSLKLSIYPLKDCIRFLTEDFVNGDFNALVELLSLIPKSVSSYFELVRNYIFLPDEVLDSDDESIYILHFFFILGGIHLNISFVII